MTYCTCGRAKAGEWDVSQCRICWLRLNDPRYAALLGRAGKPRVGIAQMAQKRRH